MKHDFQANYYAPNHPTTQSCIGIAALAVMTWMAVGYIAIVQMTGGF